jgi:EF-P beta-lysylation protein EpmB
MITRTATIRQTPDWQLQLTQAITDPNALLQALALKPEDFPEINAANTLFSLRVPRSYLERIERGNPEDPLLRQVIPLARELLHSTGFSSDPVGDHEAMVRPGLLHKYSGRALLLTTGACGIHCRYCFRRHFPYSQANPSRNEWKQAINYLEQNSEINEIILSGGDPLSLSDEKLQDLVSRLEAIPHLERLRIHTRMPVVLPRRVCPALLKWIEHTRLQVIVVIHCNHANELDTHVRQALHQLKRSGCQLLNQSVLLKGVNDSADSLEMLSERLISMGVLPYYLHMLDRVEGATHFEVEEKRAKELLVELNKRLPGYLVPRLVREIPGESAKSPVPY